jgi:hypothetical protein
MTGNPNEPIEQTHAMSHNPYAAPQIGSNFSLPMPPGNPARGPAIALIVVSAIWILILCGLLLFNVVLLVMGVPDEMVDDLRTIEIDKETQVMIRMGFGLFLIVLHSVVLFGAISMLRMKNLGLAYTAAVISVIPCCSGCYVLGIPFGIWALIVLNRPEVKASFR